MRVEHPVRDQTQHPEQGQRGSALVLVMLLSLLLSGIVISLSVAVTTQSRNSVEGTLHQQRLDNAENGLAKAMVRVQAATADYTNAPWTTYVSGNVEDVGVGSSGSYDDGAYVTIEKIDGGTASPPTTFRLRATGIVPGKDPVPSQAGQRRVIELIFEVGTDPPPPIGGPGMGAVVGRGDFDFSGNITLDGRDHNPDGTLVASGGRHVPGLNITGSATLGGSVNVGGGAMHHTGGVNEAPGITPTKGIGYVENSNSWDKEDKLDDEINKDGIDNDGDGDFDGTDSNDEFKDWVTSDGYDNDGDGTIDEADEYSDEGNWKDDKIDNDGDGVIDEDGFPMMYSGLLGQKTPHDLKTYARDNGTLFRYTSKSPAGIYRHDGKDWVLDGGGNKISYSTWQASKDAQDGGDIILIEGKDNNDLKSLDLPDNGSGKPSLLIVQNYEFTKGWREDGSHKDSESLKHAKHSDPMTDHNITVGPVHVNGTFKGLFIADKITNMNGNGTLIGSVVAYNRWNDSQFGAGNFKILFSSEVLKSLPGASTANSPPFTRVLNWREVKQ